MSLLNHWYIACESIQIKSKPRQVMVLGQRLVLWRNANGGAHALIDRCAHRNVPLSKGTIANGQLQCCYHGWCYNGAGECTHVPALADGRTIPVNAQVRSYPVKEQQGYLWLWLGDASPNREPFVFPHHDDKDWTTFRMRTRFASSVEACLENFLDCPHTAHVHRGWFRNPDPREMNAVVRRHAEGVDVEFQNEPTTDSLIARLLYPKDSTLKHADRFIMPNLSRVDYAFSPRHHFIITSQCTPVTDHETEVFTVISFRYGSIGWLVRLFFEPMSRHIIQQDVDILKTHGENVRRFDGEDYTHVETDLISLHMRSLRRRADTDSASAIEPSERTIRIRF